jgi:transposase-like protein
MHMTSSLNNSMNGSVGSSSASVTPGSHRVNEPTDTDAPSRDPEVFAIGRRRQFSASEKRALLAEAERRKAAGTLGAFCRERRNYSSMLSSWRKQLSAADRVALAPKRRGPKPDASARRVLQLTRDNGRVQRAHRGSDREQHLRRQDGRGVGPVAPGEGQHAQPLRSTRPASRQQPAAGNQVL